MPPTKTNREDIVKLLKKRKTNSYIRSNVEGKPSWAFIQGIREEEERKGLKHQEPKFRRKPKSNGNGYKPPVKLAIATEKEAYTWSEIQEALTQTFHMAKRTEDLLEQHNTDKCIIAAQENDIKVLNEKLHECEKHKLAYQQGDLPSPLRRK